MAIPMILQINACLYKAVSLVALLKCAKQAIQKEDYKYARKYLDMAKLEVKLIDQEIKDA